MMSETTVQTVGQLVIDFTLPTQWRSWEGASGDTCFWAHQHT